MKPSEYEAMIAANTPERFPNLVCNWPDEEHGITWDNYISDATIWLEETPEGEDVLPYKPFEVWKEEVQQQNVNRNDLGFSHEKCHLCGALPGERYAVTALPVDPATNHDYIALACCASCIIYIANGDIPEDLEE